MDATIQQNLNIKETKLLKITPYIFCFFIFSFLGWVLETIFCYCVLGEFIERGSLYSPICPIYRDWCIHINIIFR